MIRDQLVSPFHKPLQGDHARENAMTPTSAAPAVRGQPGRVGHDTGHLAHRGAEADLLNDRLVQHLDGICDTVRTIIEQGPDDVAAVDEAMTQVVTELDRIIFETHMFLSGLSSSPAHSSDADHSELLGTRRGSPHR
ncbi:hypothetical protein [Nocardia sp. MW-W600-9]